MREKYFIDLAPVQGNQYHRLIGAAEERYNIPAHWYGSFVLFHCKGSAIHVLFGGPAVTVNPAAVSALAAEALTPSANTGDRIAPDTTARYFVVGSGFLWQAGGAADREVIDHFCVEGEAADSEWFAWPVTTQRQSWT